jgi:colanic acid/amylovoran biosynthesis glycosyltransferase
MSRQARSICYVLPSFPECSETFIAEEAVSVMAHGVDVSIVSLSDGDRGVVHPSSRQLLEGGCVRQVGRPGRWKSGSILVALLLRQPLTTLAALHKALQSPHRWLYFRVLPAAAWCLSRRVEYFHAHFADLNLQAARALSDWLGKPFSVTTHRYDIFDDPVAPMATRELFRASSLIVTISRWNVNHMVKKYRLHPEELHVVHCGVDLSAFSFHPRRFAGDGPFRLLNVGRLAEAKDQATLLRAVARVRALGISCHLDIIGGGPLEATLRGLCDELGIANCVTLHGAQAQPVVREYLCRAHAFVLSSIVEGLPVACIEAAAIGAPLIATRINGLPELIDDGVSGLLVDPADPQALASAIAWAATHREALPAMAAAARKKVEAEFHRATCTKELLSLVNSAMGAHP